MSMSRVGAPLLHSRECILLQKMPPTGEHFVEEQRADNEQVGEMPAALAASESGSERSMALNRKKL